MKSKTELAIVRALGALALFIACGSLMAAPMASTTDVQEVGTFPEGAPTGGQSFLTRTDDEIVITLEAAGLTPGDVHTLWWIVFNNPEACTEEGGGCGEDDIFNEDGTLNGEGVMAAGIGIGNATGNVAKSDGTLEFGARLQMETNPEESVADGHQVLFGAGFGTNLLIVSPHVAEVHVIVQSHGQARGNKKLMEQLSISNANCTPRCVDIQATIHRP